MIPFYLIRKRYMCKFLRRLGRQFPSPAHVFIDGLPVGRAQGLECLLALLGIDAARRLDHRMARGRETISTGLKVFFAHITVSLLLESVLREEFMQDGRC